VTKDLIQVAGVIISPFARLGRVEYGRQRRWRESDMTLNTGSNGLEVCKAHTFIILHSGRVGSTSV
jgi:hypothetical protein